MLKFIESLKNRISLILAKGIVSLITNSGLTQKVQITCLAGETISNIERFEDYGLSSYPLAGAQAFTGFLNGNRNQGVVICIYDRRYRPSYLAEGEVAIYTNNDKTSPHRILMKADGTVEIQAGTITVIGDVDITGDLDASGDITAGAGSDVEDGDPAAVAQTMAAMRVAYNAHNHGANPGNPPTVLM